MKFVHKKKKNKINTLKYEPCYNLYSKCIGNLELYLCLKYSVEWQILGQVYNLYKIF